MHIYNLLDTYFGVLRFFLCFFIGCYLHLLVIKWTISSKYLDFSTEVVVSTIDNSERFLIGLV